MKRNVAVLSGLFFVLLAARPSSHCANWPEWRGPYRTGVSDETNVPIKWSTNQNVRWRTPLPERGNSTPIIWSNQVFITQSLGNDRTLMCFNRADGKLLWQQGVTTASTNDLTHETNPWCSASPSTDGARVIVWFGSDGLHCYDFTGRKIWSRDLGIQRHIWGYGSSPVIHGDLCFLNFGPGERSLLFAVDKQTGKTVWQHEEITGYGKAPSTNAPDEIPGGSTFIGSWSTPVPMKIDGREQLLLTWPRRLAAYDPQTGKELWSCSGLNPLVYTSPISHRETVVAMGGFNGSSFAVRAGGHGDMTDARRLWQHSRTKQRIGSGVISDGYIYIHNDPGIAECLELQTGRLVWEERLHGSGKTGQNWSSVMLADKNCYTITQGGDCFVFKANPRFELLSINSLGEPSNSSLAPSEGDLFIRTHAALWCISNRTSPN